MDAIRRELLMLDPTARVEMALFDPQFVENTLKFRPDVILTFPMTSVGTADFFYFFKFLFHCSVVCYRAEGVIIADSEENVTSHVGYDTYGPRLVDYEIFWGPKSASVIGPRLLSQKKISSIDRIKYFGYPRLERYFPKNRTSTRDLPNDILSRAKEFGRARTILFATGFHFANYTRDDIYAAKDLNAGQRAEELLSAIEGVKIFRSEWIRGVIEAANAHPDFLFVVKKHPIERYQDYEILEGYPNVIYVWRDIDVVDLMQMAGLFFHYGSTTLADAYLSGVPGIHVHSPDQRCRNWYQELGWPSVRSVSVERIGEMVDEFAAGLIRFEMNEEKWRVLRENFSIRDANNYWPSRDIASFLIELPSAQRNHIADRYMWRGLSWHFYLRLRRTVARPLKKVLQIARHYFQ